MGTSRVVVTGGARGIGRAIARRVIAGGGSVALLDVDADAGERAARELEASAPDGAAAVFLAADVGDEAAVDAAVAAAAERLGGLDGVVNNAGIGAWVPLEALEVSAWQRVLATNLTGAFLVSRRAAPWLRASRGAIVNIASTRALMSEPNGEAYAASKGGLVALTHALAVSLGPEVRVNAVSPGWIDVRGEDAEPLRPEDHAQHPVGRVGRPEDVAATVHFLLSDAAAFLTGENIVVDGGMTRKMIYLDEVEGKS